MSKLEEMITPEFLEKTIQALSNNQEGIVLVIDRESMVHLVKNEPAMIQLARGGVIVLITETLMNEVYGRNDGQS